MNKRSGSNCVKAWAPATVANVGAGFDIFGFALESPGDTVEVRKVPHRGVRIVAIDGDDGALSRDPKKNVVSAVAARMLADAKSDFGIELTLVKGLPSGSGLGSSSASAAAAAVAMQRLLGDRFTQDELLGYARFGEEVACGSAHADNVAPAIYGGFTIVRQDVRRRLSPNSAHYNESLEVVSLRVPENWFVAVVHPHAALETRKARAVVPKTIALATHVAAASNTAAAVAAIAKNDIELFCRAVMSDEVVEVARAPLIPGYVQVVQAALKSGTGGVAISGAGPSLFALTSGLNRAKVVGAAMKRAWHRVGISADVIISRMGASGARIVKEG